MNNAADSTAKRELVFELVSEILRVDGSDMASFDGVCAW